MTLQQTPNTHSYTRFPSGASSYQPQISRWVEHRRQVLLRHDGETTSGCCCSGWSCTAREERPTPPSSRLNTTHHPTLAQHQAPLSFRVSANKASDWLGNRGPVQLVEGMGRRGRGINIVRVPKFGSTGSNEPLAQVCFVIGNCDVSSASDSK